jgi:FAD binding domain
VWVETVALHIGIGPVPLRGLAALLFLGGIVYALVSGNWGIGAIVFGLGAMVFIATQAKRYPMFRLNQWYKPGLLCIGDAAHAMSPAGGVGVNYAIQDTVATANLLAAKFR